MKNVLILGCGRSGTSLVAGCLSKSGYNMGDDYIVPRKSNLKGFFEDSEVNNINEEILQKSYPKKIPFSGEWIFEMPERINHRWLSRVLLNVRLFSSEDIKNRIRNVLSNSPYCYKDTRFGYTLPIWKSYLKNNVFICVFRNPSSSADSIIRECREEYFRYIDMDFETALDIWKHVYSHILKNYELGGVKRKKWFFVHYNQLFEKETLDKLSKFTGASVDYSFPDKKLNRSKSNKKVNKEIQEIYERLCSLARYDFYINN